MYVCETRNVYSSITMGFLEICVLNLFHPSNPMNLIKIHLNTANTQNLGHHKYLFHVSLCYKNLKAFLAFYFPNHHMPSSNHHPTIVIPHC